MIWYDMMYDSWFTQDSELCFEQLISFLPLVADSTHVAVYQTKQAIKSVCK